MYKFVRSLVLVAWVATTLLSTTWLTPTLAFVSIKGTVTRNLLLEARQARTMEDYELAEDLLIRLMPAVGGRARILALTELILVYEEAGQPDRAIPFLEKMTRLLESEGDPDQILAKTYAKLAECQAEVALYQEAEISSFRALSWTDRCDSSAGDRSSILHNLAWVQESLGKSKSAEINYLQALKLLKPFKKGTMQALTAANLAELYVRENKITKAMKYYKMAIHCLRNVEDKDGLMLALLIKEYQALSGRADRTKKRIAGH